MFLTITVRVETKQYAHGDKDRATAEMTVELNEEWLYGFSPNLTPLIATAFDKLLAAQDEAAIKEVGDEIRY